VCAVRGSAAEIGRERDEVAHNCEDNEPPRRDRNEPDDDEEHEKPDVRPWEQHKERPGCRGHRTRGPEHRVEAERGVPEPCRHPTEQIEHQESDPPEPVFDVGAKYPEEHHVEEDVPEIGVQKGVCDIGPGFRDVPLEHERIDDPVGRLGINPKYRDLGNVRGEVAHDQRVGDERWSPVRAVGAEWDHSRWYTSGGRGEPGPALL